MKKNKKYFRSILLALSLLTFSCNPSNDSKKGQSEKENSEIKELTEVQIAKVDDDTLSGEEYFEKAKSLYEAKKYDSAKVFYQKAANKDHAESHFTLAYNYPVTQEENLYHYSQAAMLGHEKALGNLIDNHFYRTNNLFSSNVKQIHDVYKKAQELNPSIEDFELLELASKVPELNGKEFMEKYDLSNDDNFNHCYYIWELAEAASRGEKFENPTPLLVLQLIIKGSFVPAEGQYAISDYLNYWQQDTLVPFDLCQYITSGIGINYCSTKAANEEEKEYQKLISNFKETVKLSDDQLINNAFKETLTYIDIKAWNEECHDGSGYVAWTNGSIYDQKHQYLEFINQLYEGKYVDSLKGTIAENDSLLNVKYQIISKGLKEKPVTGMRFHFTFENFRDVQRKWIIYRDVNAKFFSELSPNYSNEYWLNYLTAVRVQDFDNLVELVNVYRD